MADRMEAKTRLLDQVRTAIRLRHLSMRTEEAYLSWIRRFILFHQKRHPQDMGAEEVRTLLSHLAVHDHVAASTQNVALNALLFLYRHVLHQEWPTITGIAHAKRPRRLPAVFTRRRSQRSWHTSKAHPTSWPAYCTVLASASWSASACG